MRRALLALLLAACGSTRPPEPRDPVLDDYAAAARDAYDQGNTALAADLYAKALDRARLGDADVDVADHAYNRALCLADLGDLDGARTLLKECRSAFARAGLDDADAALAEARLSYMARDAEGARAAARAFLARKPAAALRAEALVLLGEIACADGDAVEARRALSEAAAIRLDPASDQLALSHVHRLKGSVAVLEKDFAEAARSCDEEAAWAREARAYGAMADALERAGDAHRAAGDPAAAAGRYYRAGRSRLAAGDQEGARGPAEQALALAGPDLRPLAEALERDVEAARER
jgi:tetratricopeptide (TPR) repeat protein